MKFKRKKSNLMAFWFWVRFFDRFVLRHELRTNWQRFQLLRQVGFPRMGRIQRSSQHRTFIIQEKFTVKFIANILYFDDLY
jgi:hypothetical protein